MRGKIVRRDHEADALGLTIADLVDRVRDLEQSRKGDAMSVEDGALDVYDDDDQLRASVGKQADGSFGVKAYGKKPQTPSLPDVIPVPGGCIVEWDGTFEDAQVDDVQRVAIHVGTTADFTVNTDDDEDSDEEATERAAILSPRGGSAFLALDPGQETYYVRLTAVAEGGAESDPTDAVEVIVAAPEAAFYQDEYVLSVAGAQALNLTFTPIDFSEHLYWNGLYQREDVAWTRIGKVVTLAGTPYAPKSGDRVAVEYAYNPGEEPKPVEHPGQSVTGLDADDSYLFGTMNLDRGSFSASILFKLTDIPGAERTIMGQTLFPSWQDAWELIVTATGGLKIRANHASGSVSETSTEMTATGGSVADGKAHRLLWRYNHTIGRVWLDVDGVTVAEMVLPYLMVDQDQFLVFNRYISNRQPGALAQDLAVWKRVITDAEAADHLEAWDTRGDLKTTLVDSNPDWYWPMDEIVFTPDAKSPDLMVPDPSSGASGLAYQGGFSTEQGPALQKGE